MEADRNLDLILTPPWMNKVLAFLRVLLMLGLFGYLLATQVSKQKVLSFFERYIIKAGLVLPLFFALPYADPVHAVQYPPQHLLEEYESRLLKDPTCFPGCVQIQESLFEFDKDSFRLEMHVHALAPGAVSLPRFSAQWQPQAIEFSEATEESPTFFRHEGRNFLRISKGAYRVKLFGSLEGMSTLNLNWQQRPPMVRVEGEGWIVDGLVDHGVPQENIVLRRSQKPDEGDVEDEVPNESRSIQPFHIVTRKLLVGFSWRVENYIESTEALSEAQLISIPLLPGEKVLSSWVKTEHGVAKINLSPNNPNVRWTSELAPSETLILFAKPQPHMSEVWSLKTEPNWAFTYEGIEPVAFIDARKQQELTWKPYPKDKLILTFKKPEALSGKTLTVENARFEYSIGEKQSTGLAKLGIRSSTGGEFEILLPRSSDLKISSNGRNIDFKKNQDKVNFLAPPGKSDFSLEWKFSSESSWYRQTIPSVSLPSGASNIVLQASPDARWILWFSGPGVGPAITFWSSLILLIFLVILLGRLDIGPIKTHHWLILCLGLFSLHVVPIIIAIAFLIVLKYRSKGIGTTNPGVYNVLQVCLLLWGALSCVIILIAIRNGFFGYPDTQIQGNGSNYGRLIWFLDSTDNQVGEISIFSLHLFFYKGFMLFWALWLAHSMTNWLPWMLASFSEGGMFKKYERLKKRDSVKEKQIDNMFKNPFEDAKGDPS